MAQKTAVQCLIDELKSGKNLQFEMTKCGHLITVHDNIFDKILQMEKEQIMKAARQCHFEGVRQSAKTSQEYIAYGQQYYNETFGKQ